MAEEASQRRHLIALPPTARVTLVDNIHTRGGYAIIRRIRIDKVPEIQLWWEFNAKLSNQCQSQLNLAKMEHVNKSMVVRIPHAGVICFFAVHVEEY
jgi:hypothetical protein